MPALTRRSLLAALPGVAGLAWASARAEDAPAPPPEVQRTLPGARLRGQGRLRFLGLSIYEARLWSPADALAGVWATEPLALELQYARSLYGRLIAERSIEEMRRQADIPAPQAERWQAEMTRLFPDVAEGDRLTGVQQPGVAASFFFNGQPRGAVRDPEFTRLFFGIWLSPATSEPGLRERLLGRGT
jgi:hypothetical protein